MKSKRTLKNTNFNLCKCDCYRNDEHPVQNNLSLTPQQIKSLTDKGIPVSLPNLSIIDDRESVGYLPLEHQRGVDLNICYEASTITKNNTIKAYKQFKTK